MRPPPGRPAVLLRAGGGAAPLTDNPAVEISAIDFDSAGGGVISGTAKAGAPKGATSKPAGS